MEIPEGVRAVLDGVPWIELEEDMPEEQRRIYEIGMDEHCMTCGGELGETTMVTVAGPGIISVHCSGVCMTDMHAMGFLQQRMDDIVERIRIRAEGGGEGGQSS